MKLHALSSSNNDILLKVNDQIVLENTDLKAQLKAFRKGGNPKKVSIRPQ